MSISLRIFSSAGRVRLDGLSDNTSIREVRSLASAKLNCCPEKLALSLAPQSSLVFPDEATLLSLHLKTGSVLHATALDEALSVPGQVTGAPRAMRLDDLEPEAPQAGNDSPTGEIQRPTNPEEEKPSNEGDGGSSSYFSSFDSWLKKVSYNTGSLCLREDYKPREVQMGTLFKIPPAITLKHQAYRHIDHVELMNVQAVTNFVNFWQRDKEMLTQRIGVMYGYYQEYDHYELGVKAVVEAIFEPIQQGTLDSAVFDIEGTDFTAPDMLAASLGLERIGLIFTHLERDKVALSSSEAMFCARWGLKHLNGHHYTGYEHSNQVIVTISPDSKIGSPVPNSYMLSDLALAMVRDGLVKCSDTDPRRLKYEASTPTVMVPELLESGKVVRDYEGNLKNTFDVDWWVVRLNDASPLQVRSVVPITKFPVMNRAPITSAHASRFLKANKKNWADVADWQFLLWLFSKISAESMANICLAVKTRGTISESIWAEINSL